VGYHPWRGILIEFVGLHEDDKKANSSVGKELENWRRQSGFYRQKGTLCSPLLKKRGNERRRLKKKKEKDFYKRQGRARGESQGADQKGFYCRGKREPTA